MDFSGLMTLDHALNFISRFKDTSGCKRSAQKFLSGSSDTFVCNNPKFRYRITPVGEFNDGDEAYHVYGRLKRQTIDKELLPTTLLLFNKKAIRYAKTARRG